MRKLGSGCEEGRRADLQAEDGAKVGVHVVLVVDDLAPI